LHGDTFSVSFKRSYELILGTPKNI